MRTRSRELESLSRDWTSYCSFIETLQSNGTETDRSSWTTDISHEYKTGDEETVDVVTPNFLLRRNRGEIISNPYTNTRTYSTDGHFTCDVTFRARDYYNTHWRDYAINGYYKKFSDLGITTSSCPTIDVASETTSLQNQAIAGAWARVSESDAELLVTAAESKKAFDGIVDIIVLIKDLIQATRRKELSRLLRKRYKRRKFKTARQIWLQARYNLRPLFYEAMGLIKAYNAMTKPQRLRFTYTTSESWGSLGIPTDVEFDETPSSSVNYLSVLPKTDVHVSCTAGVLVEATRTKMGFASAFGMHNLFSAAWEVVPYSFIVDWLFNTANFVAQWNPKVGLKILTTWCTTECTTRKSIEVEDLFLGSMLWEHPWFWYGSPATNYQNLQYEPTTHEQIVRSRVIDPGRPAIPSLDISLSVAKLLDLLAIDTQKV